MNCPNCNTTTEKTYTKTKWGKIIQINQCPSCGGIWFDKWKLQNDKNKTKKINVKKLRKSTPIISTVLSCPKCKTKLDVFKNPDLLDRYQINRCNKCGGTWLNCAKLQDYKIKMQKKKRIKKKKKSSAKKTNSNDILFKMGDFISTPISLLNLKLIKSENLKDNIASSEPTLTIIVSVETLIKLLTGKI